MELSPKKHIENRLAFSALSYLKNGLEMFHNRDIGIMITQPIAGNLCIAIELLLKTIIAHKRIELLYTDAPNELLELLKDKGAKEELSKREFELKSFRYKTILLDNCISIFYSLYPEQKREFKKYFKLVSQIRNKSIHSYLPDFQKFDLEVVGYTAIKLVRFMNQKRIFSKLQFHDFFWFQQLYLSKEDIRFFKSYDEELINKVREKIETAKIRASKNERIPLKMENSWDYRITTCTVCEGDGMLYGYTEQENYSEFSQSMLPHDEYQFELFFTAEKFECPSCGLVLGDHKEIDLTNLYYDGYIDDDEEKERWCSDHNF